MPKRRPIPAPVTRPAPIARARAGDPHPARYPRRVLRIFELTIEMPIEPRDPRRPAIITAARRAAAATLTQLRCAP